MTDIFQTDSKDPDGFTPALRSAREAINLPEVQDIIRSLGKYGLGVCLPHAHDEATGAFTDMDDDLVQVEKAQQVSFQRADEVAANPNLVEVGWRWIGDEVTGMAVCHLTCTQRTGDSQHYQIHVAA